MEPGEVLIDGADPFLSMPTIFPRILAFVDLAEISALVCVSRSWKYTLTRKGSRYRENFVLETYEADPNLRLRLVLQTEPYLRSVSLTNPVENVGLFYSLLDHKITSWSLGLVNSLAHLQELTIDGLNTQNVRPSRLTHS